MPRLPLLAAALLVCGCASSASTAQQPEPAPAPAQTVRPLANLAARRIIVTPAYGFEPGDPMGWAATIQRPRVLLRQLDSAIVAEFTLRGLRSTWYFAPDLEKAYQVNSTYAADPFNLAENQLRGKLEIGKNYGEPLATQLRTMIAMQDGARRIILPVNLHFEPADSGQGRAVIRLVLVDARTTEFLWVADVKSDPAPRFGPDVLKSLAFHFADLVVAP
ncbi:MAG TPA: hypothetical protein VFK16_02710 [Gemmatimonadaceae bacterium]|nr:hypothetical protein [Gemmatimonadaceae bacterium]